MPIPPQSIWQVLRRCQQAPCCSLLMFCLAGRILGSLRRDRWDYISFLLPSREFPTLPIAGNKMHRGHCYQCHVWMSTLPCLLLPQYPNYHPLSQDHRNMPEAPLQEVKMTSSRGRPSMDQLQPQADSYQTGGTSPNTIHPPEKENLFISRGTGAIPQSRH